MGCTLAEVFWFDIRRLRSSFVVSTHNTTMITLISFPGVWHGQCQRF